VFDGIDSSVQALFVAPLDLLSWVNQIRPYIAKMADGSGGRFATSDIFTALASGRMLLWVALEGAEIRCVLVGEIMNYPRLRALRLSGLAGNNPRKWRRLLGLIEEQARTKFGCTMMESLHQPRHLSFMPGYETTHWLSEKSL
jgi:hypothetical protein